MYSVVIPSLGRIEYLNELLDSILTQDLKPIEILVLLDSNSHCNEISVKIIKNNLIKVVFCEQMNLSEKRNYGAKIASSKLLIYSDDDDLWSSRRGLVVVEALKNNLVCCHNYGKFGSENSSNLNILGLSDRQLNRTNLLNGANIFGGGSAIACHAQVVEMFNFSPAYRYCEDYEWWIRIILAGISVRYLGESHVSYRVHDSNMTGVKRDIFYFTLKIAKDILMKGINEIFISLIIGSKATIVFLKTYLRR
jgi:glycosyltransferase involved in cell wall biosynthesis